MKMNKIWAALFVATAFGFVSCTDTDAQYTIPEVEAPVLVSTTPEANAAKVKRGEITIEVKYDKNVFFATEDLKQISFTGGTLISADVYGSSNVLTLTVEVPTRETVCSLSIPEGVVLGPNKMPAPAVSLQFTTVALDKSLVNASATPAAQKVYAYLLENFESKTLSAMMANVNWNTEKSEQVYQWTGKYPAINCFDYVHLYASGANWINYSDITPVKDWWNARSDIQREEFLKHGFAGSLHKPFMVNELLAELDIEKRETGLVTPQNHIGTNAVQTDKIATEAVPASALNFSALTAFSGDDPDAAKSILESFVTETRLNADRLRQALDVEDTDGIAAMGHKMLPLFTLLGANELVALLKELEASRGEVFSEKIKEKSFSALAQIEDIVVQVEE